VIQTPLGAVPETPEYGNNILQLENSAVPQIVGEMVSVEVQRALMTNPRVAAIENVTAKRDGDATIVSYQIRAVNHLTEAALESSLRQT